MQKTDNFDKNHAFIIAEAGVNHDGSLEVAEQLVKQASIANCDAVKFQTYFTEELVTANAPKAEYQKSKAKHEESQFEMLKRLELNRAWHHHLKNICDQCGIEFMSSHFSINALRFLVNEVGVKRLKIPSGEITNQPLLLASGQAKLPIIISTGASNLVEIEEALNILSFGGLAGDREKPCHEAFKEVGRSKEAILWRQKNVTLLHCTTQYPAPYEELNLKSILLMRKKFKIDVGFSDHSTDCQAATIACALGASIFEKHFTLDKTRAGPDHLASIEPMVLQQYVRAIRDCEIILGREDKLPTISESKNRLVVRKSLFSACSIKKGEVFTLENIACKRPATGLGTAHIWSLIGRKAQKTYQKDMPIDMSECGFATGVED